MIDTVIEILGVLIITALLLLATTFVAGYMLGLAIFIS
jgi:hypothetical protein